MFKRIVSLAVLTATISACVSIQPPRDVAIATTNSKTFIFDKTPAPDVKLSRSTIKSALKREISSAASHRHGCNPMCKYPKDGRPGYYLRGAIIKSGADAYTVTYRKGDYYRSTMGEMMQTNRDITAKFPVSIEDKGDTWVVKLSTPSSLHKSEGNDDWFLFKTDAEAIGQFNKLFANLDPVLKSKLTVSGEFRVNYDPESVTTSLNRKLISKSKLYPIAGGFSTSYKLTHNDQSAMAKVKVFKNKGKSLVEYTIEHVVSLDAKGGSSFDEATLKAFKQQLIDAANS